MSFNKAVVSSLMSLNKAVVSSLMFLNKAEAYPSEASSANGLTPTLGLYYKPFYGRNL
jgi:hypothetical protein